MDYILKTESISKTFGGIKALDNVLFQMKKGEIHCLVGENGAGKSTLGKIIAGIHTPDSGIITINGNKYDHLTPIIAKELKIAMVTQELNLMPHLSIAENIYMFEDLSYKKNFFLDRNYINNKAEELFDQFNLSDLPPVTTKVSRLTMAQAQIVEIMKATSQQNNILIFDEPTTALSIKEVEELFKLILRLKGDGVAIILVTHRFKEIFEIGELVTVLCDGKVIQGRIPIEDLDSYKLVKLMVGRDIKDFFGEKDQLQIGPPVMQVNDLSDGQTISDITFTVHQSEILGIAGLVGAGRTEIMETIFGIRKTENGTIRLNGEKISNRSIKKMIQKGICLVPEDRKQKGLAIKLPISSNMNQVSMNLKKGFVVNEKQFRSDNREVIKKLNIKLKDFAQQVNNLSGGNQQKVLLAKWLAQESSVFIFDEPTRGIDVATKTEIYELIKELAKAGKAIIMVSSEMQELIAICDRILVVNEGKIVTEFSGEEATEEKILEQAISGK